MSEAQAPLNLLKKLSAARKAVQPVPKKGTNHDHGYAFVEAVDIVVEANRVLTNRGIVVLPSVTSVEQTYGRTGVLVRAEVAYEVVDTGSGETITKHGVGYGFDLPGDKAIYAALTGAKKYFLADLLSIPVVDLDPELDKDSSERRSAEAERITREQDAAAEQPDERPNLHPVPEPEPDFQSIEDEYPADRSGL